MTDLLDARGYVTELRVSSKKPVRLEYLGAAEGEYAAYTYDEDPYVVSRAENQDFQRRFRVVLKDTGIGKSGLRLRVKTEPGTKAALLVSGEKLGVFTAGESGMIDETVDVKGLCAAEREYLEQVHRILYMLLAEVDRICAKHDLQYFLVFGGLLGSLRYGDIIPWDDDIDIAMTRKDFERFKAVAPRELGEDFQYLDCSAMGGGAFLDFMCRVLYRKETVPVNVFRKVSGKCRKDVENHLPMDIFILDKAFDHPRLHKLQMLLVRGVYGLGMGHRAYLNKEEYAGRDLMTRLSVSVLSKVGRLLPVKTIFWLHDKVSTMNEGRETQDYFMSNGFLPFIHTRYSREWFDGSSQVQLGELTVSAPKDVEAYLKRAYYDYYHYPPVNKRVPEHSPEADGVF